MGQIVGIDLGTSNTVVAHVPPGPDAQPRPIADENGSVLIPSVVSMHPSGKVLVGHSARARRFVDASNTVFAAKRLMGRTWSDPDLQDAKNRLPFELRRGQNDVVRVMLRGELFTLPEISAFVLRKAKAVAEAALGDVVDRAVVTVPANFNELQRNATKLAGTLANLDVVRVLNEPTAAALAYGYGTGASERIAVYDFGGGTFDLSLLSVFEDVFRVRATAGDMFLGGDDVDFALANVMAHAFLKKHYYDARAQPEVFDQLRDAAERIKMMLSHQAEASITIPGLVHGAFGRELDFQFSMTRPQFDAVVAPFVERTMKVCAETFAKLKVAPDAFDKIVLVGGSTRIPLVRQRVAEFFGKEPKIGVDPHQAVALGAALQSIAMKDVVARLPLRAAAPSFAPVIAPSVAPPGAVAFSDAPPPNGAPLNGESRWVPSGPPATAGPAYVPPIASVRPPHASLPVARVEDGSSSAWRPPAWVWGLIAAVLTAAGVMAFLRFLEQRP